MTAASVEARPPDGGRAPALSFALAYAARGWPCFPVAGKRPLVKWRTQATTDPERLTDWFARRPDAGVAVATGAASGLVVVDVDVDDGGQDTLVALQRRYGSLGDTLWARTGSGGWHAYFRHPGGELGNSAGKLGRGVDTRGDGGLVVAPPSPHPCGGVYAWHNPDTEPAELPAWLLGLLRPPAPPRRPWQPRRDGGSAHAALEGAAAKVAATPADSGCHANDTLNWAAFRMGQRVAAGELTETTVVDWLLDAADACGLVDDDGHKATVDTIHSGLSAGMRRGPQ